MSGKRKRTGCRLGVGCGRASSCSCLQFLISSTCFFPAHSSRTGDAHICSQQECWRTGTSCSNYFPKAWPCKHGPWDHGPTQSLDAGKGACKEEKWSQNTASTAEQQGSHCCLPRPPARIVQWGSALPPSFTSRFQERRGPEGGKMVWQVNPQAELRRANCWLSSPQRQQDATEHQALWHALCTVTVTPTYWGLFPWLCPKGHFSSNKVSALKPLEAHNQNQRTEASRLRFPGCLPRCWWSTEEEIAFKWKKKKDKLKKKKEKKKILIQNLQSAVRCASARGCSPGASFKGTSQGLETAWLLQTGAWSFCWLCSPTDGDELQTGGRGLQLWLQTLTPKFPVHSSLCENSSI